MAHYLVTGAAGFIAARASEMLLEAGNSVVGLDNLNDYYDVRLKRHRLESLSRHRGFRFVHADIENAGAVEELFATEKFDAVFNLAARAGVRASVAQPRAYLLTNALGTLNVLESMRTHRVQKLVLASTSSLYAGLQPPFREDQPVNTPTSPYAASKKSAEMLAHTYHHLHGIETVVLRYFSVFGPAGRPDMAPFRFIKWIDEGRPVAVNGDGSQSRDFTFVDDIARGTIAALGVAGFEIINLGGGREPVTLSGFIARIERLLGKRATVEYHPLPAADFRESRADIARARRLLGWMPEIGIDEGLRRTVDWHRANRDWLATLSV